MKRSTERILTTHVGSLARADSLIPLLRLRESGQPYDREELAKVVREAVTDVVRKQVEAGIDIVTDGEQGKASFFGYIVERFSGFERKPAAPGKGPRARSAGREYLAFPDYYAWSERIAEPFGGDQSRLCTRAGDERVIADRASVIKEPRGAKYSPLIGHPQVLRSASDRVDNTQGEVLGRGGGFAEGHRPVVAHYHAVGEGASNVHTYNEGVIHAQLFHSLAVN